MLNHNIIKLSQYIRKYTKNCIIVLIAIAGVSIALLGLGVTFRKLVDSGLSAESLENINNTIVMICIFIVIFGICSFLRSYFINNLAEHIIGDLRNDIIKTLMKFKIEYFEDFKTGNMISTFTTDMEIVSKLIIDTLSFILRNTFMLFGAIVLMFIQSYKLSLIVIMVVPLLILPAKKLGKYLRSLSRNISNMQDDFISALIQNFSFIKTLYSFNQQNRKINEFNNQIKSYLINSSHRLKIRALFFATTISSIMLAITAVIWIGSNDIITGNLSSGQMVSFIYYAVIVGVTSGSIIEFLSESNKSLTALNNIFSIIENSEIKIETEQHNNLDLLGNNKLNIIFNNVSFSYPSRKDIKIFDNISLEIKHNQFIGIAGKSGSGKSTLIQLLLKFYELHSGQITIGGINISEISNNKIRSLISYVGQDSSIFSGSIKDNITFSNIAASDEEIKLALQITGLDLFINTLDQGIDTIVGENGFRLSGGQKQRIILARGILYNAPIMFLDESTSNLDSQSEQYILSALKKHMYNKTLIIVAHRISAIFDADNIFLINNGIVEAQGTHEELLKRSSIYHNMCTEQHLVL